MDIADRYLQEAIEESLPEQEEEPKKKWDSSSFELSKTASENPTGCFDCNICLDFAQDPVVTLCGHLYCWPCIYKWITMDKSPTPSQQCPVCKAAVSESTLVPLYGRGLPPKPPKKEATKVSLSKLEIPRRPPATRLDSSSPNSPSINPPNHYHHQHIHQHQHFHQHYSPYNTQYSSSPSMNFQSQIFHPTANALADMAVSVLPWLFGCTGAVGMFSSSNQQQSLLVPGTPRLRRQEIQAERSLSRIWAFLLCCFVLCFVFF
ncbi:E3 ubiquitin-protein ligase RMA1H1-like [Tasmannia lanceolata]|uniref:E3 ubiquitin-protein ligase RMA1H1-like n=1 Tax=Tasmannia lanceolata TaxID=3420 RepID=UPI004064B221